jgi:hypothetical protein
MAAQPRGLWRFLCQGRLLPPPTISLLGIQVLVLPPVIPTSDLALINPPIVVLVVLNPTMEAQAVLAPAVLNPPMKAQAVLNLPMKILTVLNLPMEALVILSLQMPVRKRFPHIMGVRALPCHQKQALHLTEI